jgi:hypothetical protein
MASRESIAELAYQLWIARGQPHGSHDQDWLEAERRLGAAGESQGHGAGVDPQREKPRENSIEMPAQEPVPAVRAVSRPAAAASVSKSSSTGAGRKARGSAASGAAGAAGSAARSGRAARKPSVDETRKAPVDQIRNPPIDETDDAPRSAPHDIGEG